MMSRDLDALSVATIRTLSIDAVQAAKSGHPGTPMAMAPLVYALWQKVLRFDPQSPLWPGRDRFVLSIGHASTVLYSVLHLAGVKSVGPEGEPLEAPAVSLEDLKRFRQLDSRCPGHPEHGWTAGVEMTTGPLGQGVATSVGMAAAELWKAKTFNRPGCELFGSMVYALCGDGDMMEGVSSEAASLAGHLKLSNLCWIYDSNHITIEGATSLAFSEETGARFLAYGWSVARVSDANDLGALEGALRAARQSGGRPTLIIVDSHIGYGAPHKQDTSAAHGEPLGEEEVRLAKRFYGWPEDAHFLVPEGVREHFAQGIGARGRAAREAWEKSFAEYRMEHPELAESIERMLHRELPPGWDALLPVFPADAKGLAGREAFAKVLDAAGRGLPWLVGGAADLAPSTKTRLEFPGAGDFSAEDRGGRNFHFGIREHAMAAALNGLSLGGLRPFGAGFLIFSDYARPAIRMSALMGLPVIHAFTHDSIGVGEDGPTHQPIEQLASLRSVPGLITIRPADANEVVEAWRTIAALQGSPAALILSRQALPTLDRANYAPASGLARGAYVLADAPGGAPDVVLLASGSEVSLCVSAYEALRARGVRARVVSMPSWELFEKQEPAYREQVLARGARLRVAVELGSGLGWERYVGERGRIVSMRGFGASAPLKDLLRKFGFTTESLLALIEENLK